jgi:hypothetical protein
MDVRSYTKDVPFHADSIMEELSHHLKEQFILFTNDRNEMRTKTNLMSGVCFKGRSTLVLATVRFRPANL